MIKAVADPHFLYPGKNKDDWAKDLKQMDFELLCQNGAREPVDNAENCHLARAPNHAVVARDDKVTCVAEELLKQQVWTSRYLQPLFPGWMWIIGAQSQLSTSPHSSILFLEVRIGRAWTMELALPGLALLISSAHGRSDPI